MTRNQVLGLQVFVDGTANQASGEFKVYEDNGDNRDHTQGGYAWTHTAFSQTKQRLSLTVEAPQGEKEAGNFSEKGRIVRGYAESVQLRVQIHRKSLTQLGQSQRTDGERDTPSTTQTQLFQINYKPDNAAGTEDGWRYDVIIRHRHVIIV